MPIARLHRFIIIGTNVVLKGVIHVSIISTFCLINSIIFTSIIECDVVDYVGIPSIKLSNKLK